MLVAWLISTTRTAEGADPPARLTPMPPAKSPTPQNMAASSPSQALTLGVCCRHRGRRNRLG